MRLTTDEEKKLSLLTKEEKSKVYTEISSEIIDSTKPKQLIVSGPGTGKTAIFGGKIKKWNEQGVSDQKILITSFINFIVSDLKDSLPTDCQVYTLHKFAKIIIHKYLGTGANFEESKLTKSFTLALDSDEDNIFEDIALIGAFEEKPKDIRLVVNNYLQSLNGPKPKYLKIYLNLASFYNVTTFEDSIVRAYKAILRKEGIFDFEKVIVDEYQDFNKSEQLLIELFFKHASGGIIAGDDDQSIYSMRNASPSRLLTLIDDSSWEKKSIPFCGRCKSEHVVHASMRIARKQKNPHRKDKSFIPLHASNQKIKLVNLKRSTSNTKNKNKHFMAEAEYIAKVIDRNIVESWKNQYPAYLILGKTGSHLKKIAEELQQKLGVPIGIKEQSIYENVEVQIIFSYIQLLSNQKSNIAYRRLVGIFDKKNHKEIVNEALIKGSFNELEHYQSIKDINAILKEICALVVSFENTEKILLNIVDKLNLNKSNPALVKYIESVKALPSTDRVIEHTEDLIVEEKERERKNIKSCPIQCLTIWGSKGLKAETVFMLGLEEGYLPKSNSNVKDEEVRLMYVGMTRAVKDLNLLYCTIRYDGVHSSLGGQEGPKKRSIFIDWLDKEDYEEVSFGKNDAV